MAHLIKSIQYRMINVAFILTPIDFGGSEKVSLNFLKNIDRENCNICPIVLVRPWEFDNYFISKLKEYNYKYFQIPVAIKQLGEGRDYLRIIRCFKILFSILQKRYFDIVHTNGYFADIIGVPVAKMLKIPHISTCHGFISNDKNLVLYNKLDRMALRFSDKIITVSEQIKDDLEKSGIRRTKITVIQNAVQAIPKTENYAENRRKKRLALAVKDEEFVVGYVGRLSDEKGVQYLIEAGVLLMETGKPCKILIIGDGPKRKELEDMVKIKGLEDNIIFTGFQANIEEWMLALDIFVLPSLTEGTPMALLEAMAFGIPVIATRVGGVPKVIESGINGILINPADSKALAENLKILFHNSSLRKKIATASIDLIEKKHNIHDWCRKIETQYNLLARNNRCEKARHRKNA